MLARYVVCVLFYIFNGSAHSGETAKCKDVPNLPEVIDHQKIDQATIKWLAECAHITEKAPNMVALLPDSDMQYWILMEDMEYEIGESGVKIVVPAGFVTDLASIPKPLWSIGLTVNGRYGRAAIIHDFLYWTQLCSRPQADRLLVIAMKESDVKKFDEKAIYLGVKAGGQASWDKNKLHRGKSYIRFVPTDRPRPPPNMGWEEYRFRLMAENVFDPVFAITPAYCKFGDSTKIPGERKIDPVLRGYTAIDKIGTKASEIPATTPKLIELNPPKKIRDYHDEPFDKWWEENSSHNLSK